MLIYLEDLAFEEFCENYCEMPSKEVYAKYTVDCPNCPVKRYHLWLLNKCWVTLQSDNKQMERQIRSLKGVLFEAKKVVELTKEHYGTEQPEFFVALDNLKEAIKEAEKDIEI